MDELLLQLVKCLFFACLSNNCRLHHMTPLDNNTRCYYSGYHVGLIFLSFFWKSLFGTFPTVSVDSYEFLQVLLRMINATLKFKSKLYSIYLHCLREILLSDCTRVDRYRFIIDTGNVQSGSIVTGIRGF